MSKELWKDVHGEHNLISEKLSVIVPGNFVHVIDTEDGIKVNDDDLVFNNEHREQ